MFDDRRQITDKLRQAGFGNEPCQGVIDHLVARNLIDDEAYGRALLREILRGKPAGPRFLRMKLQQKGLERHLIDQLVDEACDGMDSVGAAKQLVDARLRSTARLDPIKRKRRLWGMLARRGFDSETITEALQDLPETEYVD